MSTPMTEAHLELVKTALFSRDAAGRLLTAPMAAQLIAGCEAAAVQTAMLREYGNLCATNESLAKERDQLRAEIARLDAEKPWLKEANATNADLRAEVERLTKLRELALSDAPDQWTKEIDAAHPMETDSYGRYEIAMKMVGNRHGKYELVDLVNWLLKCADDAKAERSNSKKVERANARAERAEAELGKLQELHGCSQEMVVHWCAHAANRSLGLDQARSELATEREKVRALRLACERIVSQWDADHDTNPIGAGGRMYTLASKVLGLTEDAQ